MDFILYSLLARIAPQVIRGKTALVMCPKKIKNRRVVRRMHDYFSVLASTNKQCCTEVIGVI